MADQPVTTEVDTGELEPTKVSLDNAVVEEDGKPESKNKISKETGHDMDNRPALPCATCRRCLKPDHIAKDCLRPRDQITCHHCGEVGHISRFCPTKSINCFRCNEEGHVKSECPKAAEECVACWECLEMGHFARKCPNLNRCDKCGSAKHDAYHCVTGVYCILCFSDEHKSANCRAPLICANCEKFGHFKADCKVKPEQKDSRADRKGLTDKTRPDYRPVRHEYMDRIEELFATDFTPRGHGPAADTTP